MCECVLECVVFCIVCPVVFSNDENRSMISVHFRLYSNSRYGFNLLCVLSVYFALKHNYFLDVMFFIKQSQTKEFTLTAAAE